MEPFVPMATTGAAGADELSDPGISAAPAVRTTAARRPRTRTFTVRRGFFMDISDIGTSLAWEGPPPRWWDTVAAEFGEVRNR
ncbi:hypothetical protein GCM10010160_65530 [Acrocarpospora corrugata]